MFTWKPDYASFSYSLNKIVHPFVPYRVVKEKYLSNLVSVLKKIIERHHLHIISKPSKVCVLKW